jgi:6-phospho-beta-glucosidase
MKNISIAIIGAGSSYTPEIIEGIVKEKNQLPVNELKLYDIDEQRLEIMAGFCQRFLRYLNHEIPVRPVTALPEALEGIRFVVVQIRVGGNQQRILDEKIPLKYGIIGQETTGPGGMLKAFRTIPVMLEIAHELERSNPDAWIINYTNPTGLVAEAVNKYSNARIAGLCSGPLIPKWMVRNTLQVPENDIEYDYFGLNHLSYGYNICVKGKQLTDEEFNRVTENIWGSMLDPEIARMFKIIPIPYFQYYLHTARKINELKKEKLTRGEYVQLLEKEVFKAYEDKNCNQKPEALQKRGGSGYSEIALDVMTSIYTGTDKRIVVNVPNKGVVKGLPDDAVIEIPCLVNATGITGLPVPEGPKPFWGLITAVKDYEQIAVEAALTGSRQAALAALMAHPLVREYDIAKPLLNEMLEANREFLPAFF